MTSRTLKLYNYNCSRRHYLGEHVCHSCCFPTFYTEQLRQIGFEKNHITQQPRLKTRSQPDFYQLGFAASRAKTSCLNSKQPEQTKRSHEQLLPLVCQIKVQRSLICMGRNCIQEVAPPTSALQVLNSLMRVDFHRKIQRQIACKIFTYRRHEHVFFLPHSSQLTKLKP